MTTETISVETAINGLSRAVSSQLESIQNLFTQNISNVNEALDKEVDAYNQLVEEAEKLQSEKNQLELKLNSLKSAHEDEKLELNNQISDLTKKISSLNLKLSNYSEIKKERDALKSLDPKSMKERIARLREKSEGQLADISSFAKTTRHTEKKTAFFAPLTPS